MVVVSACDHSPTHRSSAHFRSNDGPTPMFALVANIAMEAAVPLLLAAIGFVALARGYRTLAGTTLRAPWWWVAGSLAVVAATETIIIALHFGQSAGAAQLRLAASTT